MVSRLFFMSGWTLVFCAVISLLPSSAQKTNYKRSPAPPASAGANAPSSPAAQPDASSHAPKESATVTPGNIPAQGPSGWSLSSQGANLLLHAPKSAQEFAFDFPGESTVQLAEGEVTQANDEEHLLRVRQRIEPGLWYRLRQTDATFTFSSREPFTTFKLTTTRSSGQQPIELTVRSGAATSGISRMGLLIGAGAVIVVLVGAGVFLIRHNRQPLLWRWTSAKKRPDSPLEIATAAGPNFPSKPEIASVSDASHQGSVPGPTKPVDRFEKLLEEVRAAFDQIALTNHSIEISNGQIQSLREELDQAQLSSTSSIQELTARVHALKIDVDAIRQSAKQYWQYVLAHGLESQPEFGSAAEDAGEKLGAFFRRINVDKRRMNQLSDRAATFLADVRSCTDLLRSRENRSSVVFADLESRVRGVCEEIAIVLRSAEARRLRLYLAFDLPIFEGARKGIYAGLAEALMAEVSKWEDPASYLEAKIAQTMRDVAIQCCDACDAAADPDRRWEELQSRLAALVARAGAQIIMPCQGDDLRPREHDVLQLVPRTDTFRGQTVAQTVTRGFAAGDQVLRKATVMLFK